MTTETTVRSITVYSNPGCNQCYATKRYLKKAGVGFRAAEMEEISPEEAAAVRALGHIQAPVVVVEDSDGSTQHWSTFRIDLLKELVERIEQEKQSMGS